MPVDLADVIRQALEEYGEEVCVIDMDEDEFYRLQQHPERGCPFFRVDNEYKIVEKQN